MPEKNRLDEVIAEVTREYDKMFGGLDDVQKLLIEASIRRAQLKLEMPAVYSR